MDSTLARFDYLDPTVQSNPMEFLAALRTQAPVYREPRTGAYLVTRAADLRAAASRHESADPLPPRGLGQFRK